LRLGSRPRVRQRSRHGRRPDACCHSWRWQRHVYRIRRRHRREIDDLRDSTSRLRRREPHVESDRIAGRSREVVRGRSNRLHSWQFYAVLVRRATGSAPANERTEGQREESGNELHAPKSMSAKAHKQARKSRLSQTLKAMVLPAPKLPSPPNKLPSPPLHPHPSRPTPLPPATP